MHWSTVFLFLTKYSLSLTLEDQEAWELKWVGARKRERLWMNPQTKEQGSAGVKGVVSGHAKATLWH